MDLENISFKLEKSEIVQNGNSKNMIFHLIKSLYLTVLYFKNRRFNLYWNS